MSGSLIERTGIIVGCPACGQRNRLAFASLGRTVRCGACKAGVSLPASPLEVPDGPTFDAAAAGSLPLIVDFWAPWCGPCRMVAPEIERVASQTQGRWLVVKVNTDAVPDIASRFRISSIPTLAVVRHGRELRRAAGARPAAEIIAFATEALADDTRRAS